MFKFKENTFECLSENFEIMVLTDKTIIGLFLIASNFDDEWYCPTQNGNLHAFIDVKSDDCLLERWEKFESDTEIDLTIKEKLEIVRSELVLYLKDVIDNEIKY